MKADSAKTGGDLNGSAKALEELAHYRSKNFGNADRGAADAYLKAGELYQSAKSYSQAEDAFKSALSFSKRINGESSSKSVPILLSLGDALAAQDRNSEAALYYKQIVFPPKASGGRRRENVSGCSFQTRRVIL